MIELLLAAENALSLGLHDQAERTYHQVLEADPRNGIAAVGLARVALERGDEAGALALARDALEIDPENATARRMIDRMEEVARFATTDPPPPAPAPASPNAAEIAGASAIAGAPAIAGAASAPAPAPAPATPAGGPDVERSSTAPAAPATPSPRPVPAGRGLLRRLLRRS